MPWMSFAASAGSSLLGSLGSRSAKRRQQEAADAAIRLKGQKYEEGKQYQQPWLNAGTDALSQLQQRLPDLTAGYDPAKLLTEPGYQFGLSEGQRTLEQSLAASGMTSSGAALKRAARYGTDYATTKLDEAFTRDRQTRLDAIGVLQNLAGGGQRTAENLSREGNSYADSVAGDIMGKANAGAANDIAQGNIWGNLLNQGASAFGSMRTPSGAGDMGINTGTLTGEQRRLRYLADGGPVRAEPRVGTRAPQRQGGGGGGLTREAVLAALDAARTPQQPAPVQPQPGLIPRVEVAVDRATSTKQYASGGPVRGKSGGKADTVPARLSDGEHVIDAEVVAMLGDGNTEAGHALLEELKQRVRQFKRQAPPGKPAPALEIEVE